MHEDMRRRLCLVSSGKRNISASVLFLVPFFYLLQSLAKEQGSNQEEMDVKERAAARHSTRTHTMIFSFQAPTQCCKSQASTRPRISCGVLVHVMYGEAFECFLSSYVLRRLSRRTHTTLTGCELYWSWPLKQIRNKTSSCHPNAAVSAIVLKPRLPSSW